MNRGRDASVTQLLQQLRQRPDDPASAARLASAVYAQLRHLAAARLNREAYTLSTPTDLVHEAWLRIDTSSLSVESRVHFFRVASLAMRNYLVDRARARLSQKRGAGAECVSLRWAEGQSGFDDRRVLDLGRALERLQKDHPRPAEVIQLRCFGGMELTEVSAALGISLATVKRDWNFANAWLTEAIGDVAQAPSTPA